MAAKKRTIDDYYDLEVTKTPKKKRKINKDDKKVDKKEMDGHLKKKPTKWTCDKIWDYDTFGGVYNMEQLSEAYKFWLKKGDLTNYKH